MDAFDPAELDLAPGEQLFTPTASEHWRDVAMVVGTRSDAFPYSYGFAEAGDALVAQALGRGYADLLLFPALYCYRHAVELLLKDIVYIGYRMEHEPPKVIRHHKLDVLWPQARRAIEIVWPENADDPTYLDRLGTVIGELADADPDGEQFRYGIDTDGRTRPLPEPLLRVDLRHAAVVMRKVISGLDGAISGMSDALENTEDYGEDGSYFGP